MSVHELGRRIVVVGDAGSGKSTLGAELAEQLGVPFVDLDALYWLPGWQAAEQAVFWERVECATRGDGWVLAGNYSGQRAISWPRASGAVWLDLSLRVLIPRLVVRSYVRARSGELLWGTNRESFLRQFMLWDEKQSLLRWTVGHHRDLRARYQGATRDAAYGHLRWAHLRSQSEIDAWKLALRAAIAGTQPARSHSPASSS